MTDPTDAMRAECERALDAWTQASRGGRYDLTLPGHGPSIVPGKCQRCDDFRAGFNVLAPEVRALREALERLVGRDIGCITPPPDAPMDWPGYGSFHCPWCAGKAALALSPVGGGVK